MPAFAPMRSLHVFVIVVPSPPGAAIRGTRMVVRPDDPSQPVAFLHESAAREYAADHHLVGAAILVASFRLALGPPAPPPPGAPPHRPSIG